MSKMMSKIKCMNIIIGAAVIMGAAGCASQKDSAEMEQRKAIIDDYAKIILLQDKDSANYDKALEAAGTYIEDPSQAQKIAALQTIQNITEQMDADSKECKPIEISDELGQMLENNQISRAEYQMNADSRYTYMQDCIQDLEYLREYLSYADEAEWAMDDLKSVYDLMSDEQELMREYNYAGINYWFAGWGDAEKEYIGQEIFEKLVSFSAEGFLWRDSRDEVEAVMNGYLDELEKLYDEWAAYVGEEWDELNQMKEGNY